MNFVSNMLLCCWGYHPCQFLNPRDLLIAGDAALLGGADFGTDRCNLCGGQRHGQGIFSAWFQSQCPSVLRTFSSGKRETNEISFVSTSTIETLKTIPHLFVQGFLLKPSHSPLAFEATLFNIRRPSKK